MLLTSGRQAGGCNFTPPVNFRKRRGGGRCRATKRQPLACPFSFRWFGSSLGLLVWDRSSLTRLLPGESSGGDPFPPHPLPSPPPPPSGTNLTPHLPSQVCVVVVFSSFHPSVLQRNRVVFCGLGGEKDLEWGAKIKVFLLVSFPDWVERKLGIGLGGSDDQASSALLSCEKGLAFAGRGATQTMLTPRPRSHVPCAGYQFIRLGNQPGQQSADGNLLSCLLFIIMMTNERWDAGDVGCLLHDYNLVAKICWALFHSASRVSSRCLRCPRHCCPLRCSLAACRLPGHHNVDPSG